MIESISSFTGTVVALIFCEIVKMFGVAWFKSEAPKYTVAGLEWIDERLPGLLANGVTGPEAEASLRSYLGYMSDQEWTDLSSDIDSRFSWTVFLNKQSKVQTLAPAGLTQ